MVEQNFVGDKPVDTFSKDAVKKVDEKELTHKEVHRDIASQPGATKREGVASRDPAEFDTTRRGGQGNTQPTSEPII